MKLASVEKIMAIRPIQDSDFIETATVLGWEIVIKKDEYKVGELCGYIQIDTVTPELPYFEFLRERKFRVRTISLRKQISQGLIVPLPAGKWNEGDDLTDVLGITKYSKEPEMVEEKPRMPKVWYKKYWWIIKQRFLVRLFPSLKSFNRAAFPKHIVPITDEERIQNIKNVLETHAGKDFVISEKLDGSSITIIHEKKHFRKSKYRICSRRFELFNKTNEWYRVFSDTNFAAHIHELKWYFETDDIAIQGEYIGKPQGNKYQLQKDEIRLFNIYVNGNRLRQNEFYAVCERFNIPCCPLITILPMAFDLPGILAYAEGKSLLNKNTEREGLVFRCVEDGLSFKVISNKFLLKNNE